MGPLGPALPAGHPFSNVKSGGILSATYWSAATYTEDPTRAWIVDFVDGFIFNLPKTNFLRVWCVRGGMFTADQY